MHYANEEDGRPCEHVVFHHCLHSFNKSTVVTIQPSMNVFWDKPQLPKNYMVSGGVISHGLLGHDGIVISAAHPDMKRGVLQNGNFTFFIEQCSGSLLIIEQSGNSSSIIWKKKLLNLRNELWEYLFLTLQHDGELVLTKQSAACIHKDADSANCSPNPKRDII